MITLVVAVDVSYFFHLGRKTKILIRNMVSDNSVLFFLFNLNSKHECIFALFLFLQTCLPHFLFVPFKKYFSKRG